MWWKPDPGGRSPRHRPRYSPSQTKEVWLEERYRRNSMKALQLLPIGNVDPGLLEWLRRELIEGFRIPCEILDPPLDTAFAYHPEPGQFHSSEILEQMRDYVGN